jgi:hypothetical protein
MTQRSSSLIVCHSSLLFDRSALRKPTSQLGYSWRAAGDAGDHDLCRPRIYLTVVAAVAVVPGWGFT